VRCANDPPGYPRETQCRAGSLVLGPSALAREKESRPVSRILFPVPRGNRAAIIPLGAASRRRSSDLPGCFAQPLAGHRAARRAAAPSLFGLAPDGVFQAGVSPRRRCALTAPFHPCLIPPRPLGRGRAIGGVFSVALSVGSPRLAVSKHPALRRSDFPLSDPSDSAARRPREGDRYRTATARPAPPSQGNCTTAGDGAQPLRRTFRPPPAAISN